MPVFAYKAIDPAMSPVSGTVVADTPRSARDMLRAQGLSIEHIRQDRPRHRLISLPVLGGSSAKLNRFYRELSTLLAVGIPLLDALQTVVKQHEGHFKTTVLTLRERVAAGVGLAEAMAEHPRVFDPMTRSIVEVGERAGTLEDSLARLAEFRERSGQLRGRIGTALLYPLIVLVMGLAVSLFMMTYVVPNLLTVITDSGRQLPMSTRLVKTISDAILHYWWGLIAAGAGLSVAAAYSSRSRALRMAWHRMQLRIPIYGELVIKQSLARIAIVIATLGRSGVPLVRAIQLAQKATRNSLLVESLIRCENAVYAGRDIADALEDQGPEGKGAAVIPPMVVQVFAVGQASGRLEEMLERLVCDYDQQVQVTAQRLTAVLEPLIILLLALVVGFIAFATIMPILEISDVL